MPHIVFDTLTPVAAKYMDGKSLTPAERAEVLRIAQGFACKDSAAAANVSPETIRARRKRIYRKVHVAGAAEIILGAPVHLAPGARQRREDRAAAGRAGAGRGRDLADRRRPLATRLGGSGSSGAVRGGCRVA